MGPKPRIKQKFKNGEKEEFYLEIDFKYPKKIHQKHSNFPLAPHNYVIKPEDLSPKAWELVSDIRPNPNSYNSEKLTTTLWGLNNYVVHSLILDFYVSQGLIVTKVKRGISFVSSNFLKPWIDQCTNERKNSVRQGDLCGKDFWKLMINSCLSKFCKDLKKRRETIFTTIQASSRK